MKKLLLVDANSILNRAYYGIRPLTTGDGLYTHAIYGMVNILLSHIASLSPDYCAAAFDLKAPTFRHEKYKEYKAGRKPMPNELFMQFPYAKKVLEDMGFCVLEKEGYEADDILGTLSSFAEKQGIEAYILTGDRDSLQLITDNVKVLLASTGQTILFDKEKFYEKYLTTPPHLVDIKSLMGDSSDNIPGVPGIGEKTALSLISTFGSLDGVYENIDDDRIKKSVREKLIQNKDSAYMSYELATICKEVPISDDFSNYEKEHEDKAELLELFKKLEFGALIKKMGLEEAGTKKEICEFKTLSDVNTFSKEPVYALSFDEEKIYLYDGEGGYVLDKNISLPDDLKIICTDAKKVYALNKNANVIFDVSLAAYVLDSSGGDYTLKRLCLKYLSRTEPETMCESSVYIFDLFKTLSPILDEHKCDSLYYNIELPLARVLFEMEYGGFKIDTDGLKKYGEELDVVIKDLTERIYSLCGEEFNINSPKQLGVMLYEKLGLPAGKKTKTGYSTNAETLEDLKPYHPVIEEILEYRNVSKLKGTYVEGLLRAADENGIIHTSFNQTVTATGRLSSTEPNLQNIPVRTEHGKVLRKFFVPKKEGYVLIDSDYSQIELRLLACISGDERMLKAFEDGVDIHTETASQVFGVDKDDVTVEMRKRAKAVSFGIVYGISDFSLARDIGVTKASAKKYIENYLSRFPAVSEYLENIKKEGTDKGFVTTLFGRRRYIPELSSSKKMVRAFGERIAMNSPIQGTAADVIKLAMVNTSKALKKSCLDAELILQVHDELIIECKKEDSEKVAKLLKDCMENAVQLSVKLSTETSCADNWYDCK